jgi:hypothetical protein
LRDPTNIPDPYVKLYLLPERAKDSKRKTEVSLQCGCLFIWAFYYKLAVANILIFNGVWYNAYDWWIRRDERPVACIELHFCVCAMFYYIDFQNRLCSWCKCLLLNNLFFLLNVVSKHFSLCHSGYLGRGKIYYKVLNIIIWLILCWI